jgi:hypothetical protein
MLGFDSFWMGKGLVLLDFYAPTGDGVSAKTALGSVLAYGRSYLLVLSPRQIR